ncbi:MAG TPA: SPOR domain-containing protein [Gemmatimonadales bacterium]|nr:SPOR domain-containing protein [Gemmatimonadales bacterium]
MTLHALPRSRLDRLVPPLVRDAALVVIVPVTEDTRWAAESAWTVARAAAAGGHKVRRAVALVDLRLEAPLLHQFKGLAPTPGIADAFASDAALSDVARDQDGIHFLPAGTPVADAAAVISSPRWRRLQAGFRNEGALLFVLLAAERLAEFGAEPDGVLALSPGGVDLGSVPGRALLAARERGIELLGVVRERWSATAPAATPALRIAERPSRLGSGLLVAAAAAAIIATVFLLTPHGAIPGSTSAARLPFSRESFGTAQASISTDSLSNPDPGLPTLARSDSGGWTLQLAAYGSAERAQAHVDHLAAAGIAAFVSPLAPDASGAVWYRVLAGAFADRVTAARARRMLWDRGLAARGAGTPLLAPYSLVLAHSADASRLRTAGLTGVRWGVRNAVLVGAFEQPDQASVAASQLRRLGIATTLVTRTDRTP